MAMNGMAGMIERMWLHLEESATTLLQFAVIPILKILVLCSFGYALASNKINILPEKSRKLLSKVQSYPILSNQNNDYRKNYYNWCKVIIISQDGDSHKPIVVVNCSWCSHYFSPA